MESNNNKFVTNLAFPMRICYLKDQQKVQKSQKQQNPSIAYLSSIIQSQRKRSQSQNIPFRNMKPNEYQKNSKQKQIIAQKQKSPIKTFQGWRSTKNKSKSQDKPLLTCIVGNNWHKFKTRNKTHLIKSIIKNKSFVSEKQKQMKQKNQELQSEHFYQFVKNKHRRPQPQPQKQPTFLINKPDSKLNISKLPFFNKTSYRPIQIFKQQKPRTSDSNKRSSVMNSIVGRKNFKALSNFQWSRLSEANNFSLI